MTHVWKLPEQRGNVLTTICQHLTKDTRQDIYLKFEAGDVLHFSYCEVLGLWKEVTGAVPLTFAVHK